MVAVREEGDSMRTRDMARRATGAMLIACVVVGGCTGSRTVIPEVADPTLTGEAPLPGQDSADDGMGLLDDVAPDDADDAADGGVPTAGAAGGAAPAGATPGAPTGQPGTTEPPAADPIADLIAFFLELLALLLGGGAPPAP